MNSCPSIEFIQRYRSGDIYDQEQERIFETHLATCKECQKSLRIETKLAVKSLVTQLMPSPAKPRHIDTDELIAFVRDEVDETLRERIADHILHCNQCKIDLADIEQLHTRVQDTDTFEGLADLTAPTALEKLVHLLKRAIGGVGRLIDGAWKWWQELATNGRLVIAILLGIAVGLIFREHVSDLQNIGDIFLRILEILATLYIFVAIVHTLLRTEVTGRTARRFITLALSNTLVAVLIGITMGNIVQPGIRWHVATNDPATNSLRGVISQPSSTVIESLLNNVLLVVVSLAIAFGITLRTTRHEQIKAGRKDYVVVQSFLATIYRSLTLMLNGIVVLFPIAVFAVIAAQVGHLQWRNFEALLGFSLAVLLGLSAQITFYLVRLWFGALIQPLDFLQQCRDPLMTAFSTASSAVTLPLTYRIIRDRLKVRVRAAGLGVLVGGQFNRDGTALYEAITPIFVAQALGHSLSMTQYLLVMTMAIIASISAPGMPNAGLVTMVLVFRAVDLPTQYILLLPAVDWFLDRCRTTVNVMGTMTVACLLDRRTPPNDPRADATEHYEEIIEPEILD